MWNLNIFLININSKIAKILCFASALRLIIGFLDVKKGLLRCIQA